MKRVLVIDDEKIERMMVYHAIQPLGFEVEMAGSAEDGLKAAMQNPPDLIISDVMMPGMNGYDLVRRLRRQNLFAQTPIIILTAQSELIDKLEAFEAGADDYMTKPFEPAELVARINVLLKRIDKLTEAAQKGNLLLSPQAQVIAVHSLRGGVGCSSLAANLGIALAQIQTKSTLVMDLVLTAGQIALMFNAPLKRTWADIARIKADELDWDALGTVIGKHDSGVNLISAPTFPVEAELLTPELFSKAFQILQSNFDYIVVDLPHDFSGSVIEVLDAARAIVVLMAPEVASVRATAAAFDTYRKLEYPPEKIKLVINWTFQHRGVRRKTIELTLRQPAALVIPYAPDLFVEAINQGRPISYDKPDHVVSGTLATFARQISK